MADLSRRKAIQGVASQLVVSSAICCGGPAFAQQRNSGCLVSEQQFRSLTWHSQPDYFALLKAKPFRGTLLNASDDRTFDKELTERVLQPVCDDFEIRPGFGYYDEREAERKAGVPIGEAEQALATAFQQVPDTKGTVVFGLAALRGFLARAHGEYAILALCAHEFAHIKQYQLGMTLEFNRRYGARRGLRLKELQADFVAGYFLARFLQRPREGADIKRILNGIGQQWFDMGSGTATQPGSHGTSDQRFKAIVGGYRYQQANGNADIASSLEAGETFAVALG